MGKYSTTFKNSLSVFIQYRLNLGLILVSQLVSLSGLVFLWLSIYSSGQQMGNYGLQEIITYYVLVTLIATIIGDGIGMAFDVVEDINRGEIIHYLLKPFSYVKYRFLTLVGAITINLMFMAPLIIIGGYLMRQSFSFPSASGWVYFCITLSFAILFEFLIFMLASLSSFWVVRGSSFIYATILITGLFDGSLIPLDLFPYWAYHITSYLPFQFIIFTPIQAFLENIYSPAKLFSVAMVWIIILLLLLLWVWKRGVKKLEGVGR
ncbi:MAG: ABC-2 family transporter protein [Candidatus Magasanikbacteria bacterium]